MQQTQFTMAEYKTIKDGGCQRNKFQKKRLSIFGRSHRIKEPLQVKPKDSENFRFERGRISQSNKEPKYLNGIV